MAFKQALRMETETLVAAMLRCIAAMPRGKARTLLLVDCRATQEAVESLLEVPASANDDAYRLARAAYASGVMLGHDLGVASAGVEPSLREELGSAQRTLQVVLDVLDPRVSMADRVLRRVIVDGDSEECALDAIERSLRL